MLNNSLSDENKDILRLQLHNLIKEAILSASAAKALAPQDDIFCVVGYLSGMLTNNILEFIENKQYISNHNLYKTGDSFIPDKIKDRNGEVVLQMCKICGKAENELNSNECGKL